MSEATLGHSFPNATDESTAPPIRRSGPRSGDSVTDPTALTHADVAEDTVIIHVVEAVVVKPGDRVLIRVDPGTHPDELAAFAGQLRQHFPGGVVTIVRAEQLVHIPGATLESEARPLAPLPDAVALDRLPMTDDDLGA